MSGGASRRHSSFGVYVLSKTYIAIKNKPRKGFKRTNGIAILFFDINPIRFFKSRNGVAIS
jgi:hypothetical protein